MNGSAVDRLFPDSIEPKGMPPPLHAALSAVPSTLRIPLAARALGDAMFPGVAVGDRFADVMLAAIGDDGRQWLQDKHSIYGVLARTRCFRALASHYLKTHPDAHVVNLGCGLSHYFQWLDNGRMRMTDADLPEVLTMRRALLETTSARYVLADIDLTAADWWDRLGLPATRDAAPVFLFTEGVLMYLTPTQTDAVLRTFGERAPAGSMLVFDAMCWLAAGRARQHPSVKHTSAEFQWGPRRTRDLVKPHARLRHDASYSVMEGYGFPYNVIGPIFRLLFDVPFYAVHALTVKDTGAMHEQGNR